MARVATAVATLAAAVLLAACGAEDEPPAPAPAADGGNEEPLLSGTQTLLDGGPRSLERFRGDVVMVVNTASECGFTPQFDGLERLYRERRDQGFVILGFPADDVAGQEPRTDRQIAEFCEANFGVSFPMFAKSNLVSEPVNPLFERLNAAAGPPSWNFNKYLLDRDGKVVEHYDSSTAPDDPELNRRIDQLLAS